MNTNITRTFPLAAAHLCMATILMLFSMLSSCTDLGTDRQPLPVLSADAMLFQTIRREDPLRSYVLFPNADSVTSGTLNGSTAHQPLVRVSLNATAMGALQEGSLPSGSRFPDGSVVFKQIITNGETILYAVMRKDTGNPMSAQGWLWAEYHPDGTTAYSVTSRGSGCVGCHAREQGPGHDFVRTFERQR